MLETPAGPYGAFKKLFLKIQFFNALKKPHKPVGSSCHPGSLSAPGRSPLFHLNWTSGWIFMATTSPSPAKRLSKGQGATIWIYSALITPLKPPVPPSKGCWSHWAGGKILLGFRGLGIRLCRDFNYLIFIAILIQPGILKCAKYLLFPDLEFQILPGCSCCANCYWVSSLKRLFLEFGMGFSFPFGDTSIALKHSSPFVPARTDSAARGFSLWGLKKTKPFHLFGV